MGLTHIKLNVANPAKPKRSIDISFLVDSGAVYSVIPSALLRKLGVRPHSKRTFTLADGSEITRKIGDVLFRLDGRQGAAPVVFGEKERQHVARHHFSRSPRDDARPHEARTPPTSHASRLAQYIG